MALPETYFSEGGVERLVAGSAFNLLNQRARTNSQLASPTLASRTPAKLIPAQLVWAGDFVPSVWCQVFGI